MNRLDVLDLSVHETKMTRGGTMGKYHRKGAWTSQSPESPSQGTVAVAPKAIGYMVCRGLRGWVVSDAVWVWWVVEGISVA